MIHTEAVKAAGGVLAYHQRRDITSCMCGWSELGRSHAMHQAQLALEAAAPHLMAEAFEQGQKSGLRHTDRLVAAARIGGPELPGPMSPNPYRPTIE